MPYAIKPSDGKFCVVNSETDKPVEGGVHATRAQALAHMRALYANAPDASKSVGQQVSSTLETLISFPKYKTRWGTMHFKSGPIAPQRIEDRTVTGIAAVIGNVDEGDDRIHPGAFTKTLQEGKKRVRHLWQHKTDEPPTAHIIDLQEVGRADTPADLKAKYPDAIGALIVTREYLDTPRANEVLAGIKSGAVDEMSFGYTTIKGRVDFEKSASGRPIRNLREVRLMETSDVLWGMNPATRASKSIMELDPEDLLEMLQMIDQGETLTDADHAALARVVALVSDMEQSAPEAPEDEIDPTSTKDVSTKPETITTGGVPLAKALLLQLEIMQREMEGYSNGR